MRLQMIVSDRFSHLIEYHIAHTAEQSATVFVNFRSLVLLSSISRAYVRCVILASLRFTLKLIHVESAHKIIIADRCFKLET